MYQSTTATRITGSSFAYYIVQRYNCDSIHASRQFAGASLDSRGHRRSIDVGDEAGAFDREALGSVIPRTDGASPQIGDDLRLPENSARRPAACSDRPLPQSGRMVAAEKRE